MNNLIEGIKEHLILNEEEILKWEKRFAENKDILLLYDGEQVIGCIAYECWTYAGHQSLELLFSFLEDESKLPILIEGTKVVLTMFPQVTMINTIINEKRKDLISIMNHYGLSVWYEYMVMLDYESVEATTPHQLTIRNIEEKDFETYFEVMGECFVWMRETVDIQPHNVVEKLWENPEKKQESYEDWLKHKEQTWMYFDQDVWVGSGLIVNQHDIDDVFVVPSLQGKGYGKAIILDLVQRIEKLGHSPTIGFVKVNEKAKQLYLSCGFKITHHFMHMRRL
jgi:GNAT superfamily N-acetyltransferase